MDNKDQAARESILRIVEYLNSKPSLGMSNVEKYKLLEPIVESDKANTQNKVKCKCGHLQEEHGKGFDGTNNCSECRCQYFDADKSPEPQAPASPVKSVTEQTQAAYTSVDHISKNSTAKLLSEKERNVLCIKLRRWINPALTRDDQQTAADEIENLAARVEELENDSAFNKLQTLCNALEAAVRYLYWCPKHKSGADDSICSVCIEVNKRFVVGAKRQ